MLSISPIGGNEPALPANRPPSLLERAFGKEAADAFRCRKQLREEAEVRRQELQAVALLREQNRLLESTPRQPSWKLMSQAEDTIPERLRDSLDSVLAEIESAHNGSSAA